MCDLLTPRRRAALLLASWSAPRIRFTSRAMRRSNRLFGLLLVVGMLAVILGVAAAVYLLAQALLG